MADYDADKDDKIDIKHHKVEYTHEEQTDLDPTVDITDSDGEPKPDLEYIVKQEVEECVEYKLDMADGEDNKDDIEIHENEIDPDVVEDM